MANKIDILIKAKDEASKEIEGVTDSLKDLGEGSEELEKTGSKSFGDFMDNVAIAMLTINQAIEVGMKIAEAAKVVYDGTVGKALTVANEIETLSRISGDAPENMSALRVAAEEAKVPFEDLYKAMENLNKNGIPPTIDNLVAIADEYVNLQDPLEKAKLLTDNFGAAGDEIAPMLEAIAGGVKAVDDAGLIFTEEEIQAANDYEAAVADLQLAWENLTLILGTAVMPGLTEFFGNFTTYFSSVGTMTEYIGLLIEKFKEDKNIIEFGKALNDLTQIDTSTAAGAELLRTKTDELDLSLHADAYAAGKAATAHDKLVMSIFEESRSWEDFSTKMSAAGLEMGMLTEDIYDAEKQAGMTAAELAALNEIDIDDKEFTVKALIDTSAVDEWDAPAKYGRVYYTPSNPVGQFAQAAGGAVQAAAAGLAASMPYYWVGERGPEPFFPSQDGRIVSNTQAMSALRGGAEASAKEIANAVKQGVKEAMRDTGGGKVYNLTMPTSSNPADVRMAFELLEAWA